MKTFFCLLMVATSVAVMAQNKPCPGKPEDVKGAWSLESRKDFRYNPDIEKIARPKQANLLAQRDTVLRMIQRACPELKGFKATLLSMFVQPSVVDSGYVSYDHYTHYNPYICTYKGTLEPVESATNFRVGINTLEQENFLRHQFAFDAIGENLYSIPPSAGMIQGFPAYQMGNISSAERYGVILSRKDALPYKVVSKGEFYTLQKKLIRFTQEKNKADIRRTTRIRPEKDLRAELQAEMDEIDKSSLGQDAKNSRKRRLQEDFRTDEQMLQEKLAAVDKQYNDYYRKVEELESRYKSELGEPAYLQEYEYSTSILGNESRFFNDPVKGYTLIRMNPAYFLKTPDKWKPQFMLLTWRVEKDKAYSLALDAAWRKDFDMKALEKMLLK
jgi:hypothetical protein